MCAPLAPLELFSHHPRKVFLFFLRSLRYGEMKACALLSQQNNPGEFSYYHNMDTNVDANDDDDTQWIPSFSSLRRCGAERKIREKRAASAQRTFQCVRRTLERTKDFFFCCASFSCAHSKALATLSTFFIVAHIFLSEKSEENSRLVRERMDCSINFDTLTLSHALKSMKYRACEACATFPSRRNFSDFHCKSILHLMTICHVENFALWGATLTLSTAANFSSTVGDFWGASTSPSSFRSGSFFHHIKFSSCENHP